MIASLYMDGKMFYGEEADNLLEAFKVLHGSGLSVFPDEVTMWRKFEKVSLGEAKKDREKVRSKAW
jgi:hypothetical protein